MAKVIEMYKPAVPDNYARFYGLLRDMPGMDKEELKRTVVLEFTEGRTDSLKEMTLKEYKNACEAMKKIILPGRARTAARENLRRARSAALHQMQLLGVDTTNWKIINRFCRDRRIAGREFDQLSCSELQALSVKIRMMRRKQEQ